MKVIAAVKALGPAPGRPGWAWRAAAALAALGAGALLAAIVAWWGWRWFGPAPAKVAPNAAAPTSIEAIVAAAPFGRAPAPTAAPAGNVPQGGGGLPADARLLGVFAGRDGDGYALLRLPDRGPVLVKTGQDIVGGTRLEAVRPNGIRVRDGGGMRDIPLRPEAQPAAAPAASTGKIGRGSRSGAGATGAAATTASAACALPAGFTGSVYKLNAELLTGMAAQPQSWAALLAPGPGALVVRDETGLAAMLGMKAGDRLLQANGIALTAIDDVLAAIVKPLVASQQVRLTGSREGKPREWLFLNAGVCPV